MAVYLGLDLGSCMTRITAADGNTAVYEPTVAAVDAAGNVVAAGTKAMLTHGRAPGTVTLRRPLVNGAVTDFNLLAETLDRLLESAAPRVKKHIAVAVNCSMSESDRKALTAALSDCRCGSIRIVESPLAALTFFDSTDPAYAPTEFGGTVLCDIGGGAVEVCYIRGGEMLRADRIIGGGDAADREIITYIRRRYDIALTELQVQDLKHRASLLPCTPAPETEVTGVDVTTGIPRKVRIPLDERFIKMCAPQTDAAAKLICSVLGNLPHQGENKLTADRILVYGGGADMNGIAEHLSNAAGCPVTVVLSPAEAVSKGLYLMFKENSADFFKEH